MQRHLQAPATEAPAKKAAGKEPPMGQRRNPWVKYVVLGAGLLALLGVGIVAAPHVLGWLHEPGRSDEAAPDSAPSARLFHDAQGRPGLVVSSEVVRALHIATVPVRPVSKEKPLPAQLGQTAYDIDRLYPVRSIANGKVVEIRSNSDASESSLPDDPDRRPLGFGDTVTKDQLIAVVRSPDLAEKKGAFVDALLDLAVDQERLEALEGPYRRGAIAEATYRDALAKVQKDFLTVGRTRRILELVPLDPDDARNRAEIEKLEKEADEIKRTIISKLAKKTSTELRRLSAQESKERVEKWARVEVRAPAAGTIVEKNTNVGDIADPGKEPPLFRVADLKTLGVWVHPPEEYLGVLQTLLKKQPQQEIRLELKLQSDPNAPTIHGRLLRFAPSLDPLQRTPLLMGRIENPDKRLLIGQLLKVTIFVPQESGLVQIPAKALNDVRGESLVFVRERGFFGGNRFVLRRVAVVHRFADTVQVRSRLELTDEEKSRQAEEVKRGKRPIEPLRPGEEVLVGGVVEMTDALDNLLTESAAQKDKG